ncbi:Low-density lipoprotein (LDL) receptor class A repeat [Trinorchestia longiramus]|nr:Low-density lipoprotein (LDL) receptor class A repeat [Trinorchestia longiramus]
MFVSALSPPVPISELCRGSRHTTRVIVGALVTSNAERELDCEVTFQTDTILQKFMLRFEKIELDCNDHLWVYDSAYSTGTPLKDLSCRDTLQNVATIYTHSNHVTLKYKTDEWGPLTNGFKLIITAFKHKKDACRDFRCQTTEFCISRVLACDSVNHCGDESDESNSYASCPTPPLGELLSLSAGVLVAVGGVLVCVLVLVGVVLGTVVCIRRRRRLALLLQQRRIRNQQHAQYQLGQTEEQYGTNGTYGTVLVEKPPPYPGLPHHTNLGNQASLGPSFSIPQLFCTLAVQRTTCQVPDPFLRCRHISGKPEVPCIGGAGVSTTLVSGGRGGRPPPPPSACATLNRGSNGASGAELLQQKEEWFV